MALQERQPGCVWVQSVIISMCGFRWRSVGWGNVSVERNSEGREKTLLEDLRREGWYSKHLTVAQCWAVWSPPLQNVGRHMNGWEAVASLLPLSPTPWCLHNVTEKPPGLKLFIVCMQSMPRARAFWYSCFNFCWLHPSAPHNSCWRLLNPHLPSPQLGTYV